MLPFPPVGQRVKTTLQNIYVGAEPMVLLEHDPGRLFAVVYLDSVANVIISVARTPSELSSGAGVSDFYAPFLVLYGPEQVWVVSPSSALTPGNILLHQVFAA